MRLKKKHYELKAHLNALVDRNRWPDYVLTDNDLKIFIAHESTGRGSVPEPLAWAKKVEEITIQQMWFEMAEHWANGWGWWNVWRDNLSRAWATRNGSNIFVRKILAQARLIKKHKKFIEAMFACTAFGQEDRARYCNRWLMTHGS